MSKQTESSFLIGSSVPALYQHLLRGVASYQALGQRILDEIKKAYAFRQVEQVKELAGMLARLPIREYELVAQYYLVWCQCRKSDYRSDILERIAERTHTYKAKALKSRGTFDLYEGRSESALYFYTEALKASESISDYVAVSRGIATAKSIEGFHASALRDIERLIPWLRHVEPLIYFEVINSYAVELLAANKLSDAQDMSRIAVSSPYGPFYSEWQETFSEARRTRKRSSVLAVPPFQEGEATEYESGPPDERYDTRVQSVIDYMTANLQRRLSLRELADAAYLSPSRFSHLFKKQTGFSPGEYLIKLRMDKAHDLLLTPRLSIKEVMALVGYDTRSNFVRHFRRYFDVAPSEYRKHIVQQQ